MDLKEYTDYKDELILRDLLAFDRTQLALMRTFLSIVRTALGLLASGAGLVILQDNSLLIMLGYILIAAAALVLVFGISYYRRFKKRLDALK